MSTFVVLKHIPLDFLGEGWEAAYIDFTPFTFADNDSLLKLRKLIVNGGGDDMSEEHAKSASEETLKIVKSKFIAGQGFNGKELEPITKDNLQDLPMEIIIHVLKVIQGQSDIPPNV